jgi:hypothetical protein
MRDYNHWAVLDSLCELQPRPENRVTLADENDLFGMPVARFDYTQCENDRANIAFAKQTMHAIWETAGAHDVLTIDRYAHLVVAQPTRVDNPQPAEQDSGFTYSAQGRAGVSAFAGRSRAKPYWGESRSVRSEAEAGRDRASLEW